MPLLGFDAYRGMFYPRGRILYSTVDHSMVKPLRESYMICLRRAALANVMYSSRTVGMMTVCENGRLYEFGVKISVTPINVHRGSGLTKFVSTREKFKGI